VKLEKLEQKLDVRDFFVYFGILFLGGGFFTVIPFLKDDLDTGEKIFSAVFYFAIFIAFAFLIVKFGKETFPKETILKMFFYGFLGAFDFGWILSSLGSPKIFYIYEMYYYGKWIFFLSSALLVLLVSLVILWVMLKNKYFHPLEIFIHYFLIGEVDEFFLTLNKEGILFKDALEQNEVESSELKEVSEKVDLSFLENKEEYDFVSQEFTPPDESQDDQVDSEEGEERKDIYKYQMLGGTHVFATVEEPEEISGEVDTNIETEEDITAFKTEEDLNAVEPDMSSSDEIKDDGEEEALPEIVEDAVDSDILESMIINIFKKAGVWKEESETDFKLDSLEIDFFGEDLISFLKKYISLPEEGQKEAKISFKILERRFVENAIAEGEKKEQAKINLTNAKMMFDIIVAKYIRPNSDSLVESSQAM
jgi:hypothetical protein